MKLIKIMANGWVRLSFYLAWLGFICHNLSGISTWLVYVVAALLGLLILAGFVADAYLRHRGIKDWETRNAL